MPDDNPDIIDDQFDIRDDNMDIDDSVSSGTPSEPFESNSEPGVENWQTELAKQAKAKGLSSELVSQIEGASAVSDLLSIISSVVQKEPISAPEPEVKYNSRNDAPKEDFDVGIDEATAFDPDAVRAIRAMNEHYSKRIRDLEARIADRSEKQSLGTTTDFVKTLGAEWRQVFGTPEKPNAQSIKKLEDSVQTIRAGYASRHKRIPDDQEILKMALNASFGDKANEIARNQLNDKVAKRASQMVARPGTRTAPVANPRMRAAQGVADWFRSKGIDPFAAEGDEFK